MLYEVGDEVRIIYGQHVDTAGVVVLIRHLGFAWPILVEIRDGVIFRYSGNELVPL